LGLEPVRGVLGEVGTEAGVDAPGDRECGPRDAWPLAIGTEVGVGVGSSRAIQCGCAAMNLAGVKS
jgi:hypothetical protein